jgi:pimeloyl-ACP methyl ester carboxylesterase
VLVPGFGGFDALGRVHYYSGITQLFRDWKTAHTRTAGPVVLHYFDNLPTAAVVTRAKRLQTYLATRIARGEITSGDKIVLVGHSTGGLDIRRLIYDLGEHGTADIKVDGGVPVTARDVRRLVDAVVFLSVPHWGTNIADWVRSHCVLRKTAITDLRIAFEGSQYTPLDRIETGLTETAACLAGADLILALRDALVEANGHLCGPDPTSIADAQEAASELELYFRQMATDFRVIDDLTSDPARGKKRDELSPAHFSDEDREGELEFWKKPRIFVLSYATVGGRPFQFLTRPGCPAPVLELCDPCSFAEVARASGRSAGTDIAYRLSYRACAGGPFKLRPLMGKITRVLGKSPSPQLELWDNDGIVNTISMLWPNAENALVAADHLDIVGHFRRTASRDSPAQSGCVRTFESYDSLKSEPRLSAQMFEEIWSEIFSFAADPGAFKPANGRRTSVKIAQAQSGGC